jgi:hypothetical protein
MEFTAVGSAVNSLQNDFALLVERLEPDLLAMVFFNQPCMHLLHSGQECGHLRIVEGDQEEHVASCPAEFHGNHTGIATYRRW